MTDLLKIPTWAEEQYIYAVVETPRGSTCKLDFDPALRAFTLAKPLMAGLTYPYDWGFIPSTKAEDGDPLDVLVIHDAKTYPGVVLRCRPVGILEVEQKSKGKAKERNDRVFAVPDRSPLETDLQDIRRIPSRAREELEEFFRATNALEDKKLKFLGWHGPTRAIKTSSGCLGNNSEAIGGCRTSTLSKWSRCVELCPRTALPYRKACSAPSIARRHLVANLRAAECPIAIQNLEGRVVDVAADAGHRFSKPLRESINLVAGYGVEGDARRQWCRMGRDLRGPESVAPKSPIPILKGVAETPELPQPRTRWVLTVQRCPRPARVRGFVRW